MKNNEMILALTGASVLGDARIPGQITVANTAMNYAGALSQEVSGYLASLPAGDLEGMLDLLFPPIETADFFQFPKSADEYFLTEADDSDVRALGASFKRIEHRGSIVTDAVVQKGLTKRVEHRTLAKVNGRPRDGWENREAAHLRRRLVRAEMVRGLALINSAANNENKTWDETTNPDGDLRAQVQRSRIASGMNPTHLLIGNGAQQLRQDAYEHAARANHAMARHADYDMAMLARYAGARQAMLHDGIKQAKKGATKVNMLDLVTYTYSAEAGQGWDDPSNVKRAWSPIASTGGMWAVYIEPGADWTDITVFHQSKIFSPITAGIEKLTVSA